MSPHSWHERIHDILEAIQEIHLFVTDITFEDFQNDLKTIRAVELNFIIIGEAANAIPKEIQDDYSEIPWHVMPGMRKRLVHAYFSISPQILWDTIQQDLPLVVNTLERLIQNLKP